MLLAGFLKTAAPFGIRIVTEALQLLNGDLNWKPMSLEDPIEV